MPTLSLGRIRSMVRDELNEQNTNVLTDAELTAIINDGYKDVCVKGLGNEQNVTLTGAAGQKIFFVPTGSARSFRVNFMTHAENSMLRVSPTVQGHPTATISGSGNGTPFFYFTWGDYVVVDPPMDSAAASANTVAFTSGYPLAALVNAGDMPTALPVEFHESIFEYAKAFAAIKLKRWTDVGLSYNQYISNLQRKRFEYFHKVPDTRVARQVPDSVSVEYKTGQS